MLIAIIDRDEGSRRPKCCDECDIFVPTASDYGYCPITGYHFCLDEQEETDNRDCPLREVYHDALSGLL